ncbi:MAG: IS110 family transposase [Chloroflexota bacterium]|nr:IS110 family transposase [Chloroflexota bacterium]
MRAEVAAVTGPFVNRLDSVESIPGISDITAAGLIVHLPELGMLTRSGAASLAGLAPVTRESGNWKGRSFIQGGRHRVRRLLFMPALVAVQHNPDLKRKYEALLANGKPPQGRPDGRDAEAPRPRQRPDAAGPQLDGPSAARVLLPGLPAPSPAGSVHG